MPHITLKSLLIVVLLAAGALSSAEAQTPATAQTSMEFGATIDPGDKIFVTDRSGVQTEGEVLRFSPSELTLLVGGEERVMSSSGIGRIEKRDPPWNGMAVGFLSGAMLGTLAGSASCSPQCNRDVAAGALFLGGLGAGIGALIDASTRGYLTVAGPDLPSPNARGVPEPVTSLDQLWLRVRQDDRIGVVTVSGTKIEGRFVRVSNASVTLRVDGALQEIPASNVVRVTRAGNRARSGALWGAVISAALMGGASAACHAGSGNGNGCGDPLGVAVFGGLPGAFWGAVLGAVIPQHPVVYGPGAADRFRVTPMMGPGRLGVALSATF